MPETDNMIEVKDLRKYFPLKKKILPGASKQLVKAVDDVSFEIKNGEVLGLVGESGCGKSTLGLSILRLHEPTSGEVYFQGTDLLKQPSKALRSLRKDLQIIFQDPYSSLNSRLKIGNTIAEPLDNFGMARGGERATRIDELLDLVGLSPEYKTRYPHEFSGGQRQRICIARALASNPRFVVCDESVSALDVSIQAQILNLLVDLKNRLGLTYLFISHDLLVVNHIADRIAVMYLGKIVELSDRSDLFFKPLHPYTQALLSCVPLPDPEAEEKRERILLSGDVPSPIDPPSGCYFHLRCRMKQDICEHEYPELRQIEDSRLVACHLVGA